MDRSYYLNYIKNKTTGYGVLETELSDASLSEILNDSLQEVARYYDQSLIKTVPAARVIDISELDAATVVNVYRANSPNNATETMYDTYCSDPTFMGF